MALPFFNWSRTAATNATADSTVNWAEGQLPSTVNDSARAMMASTAAFRDDISGSIGSAGTSTAYTVTSFQVFDSLAHMDGHTIAFTAHTTNGTNPTLNVDGLGAKSLTFDGVTPILPGMIIAGTPYTVMYYNAGGAFRMHSNYVNPYLIPIGSGIDWWGSTVPSSGFAFPVGQALSRSTFSILFGILGTAYGAGDGSTTFNLPDKTGRISAMKEAANTRLSLVHFTGDSTVLGGVGGADSHSLTTAELASHSHANSLTDPQHTHTVGLSGGTSIVVNGASGSLIGTGGVAVGAANPTISTNSTGITITNASTGSGNNHTNLQPTIICNYIMRII